MSFCRDWYINKNNRDCRNPKINSEYPIKIEQMKKREDGFYFVKILNEWKVCKYYEYSNTWEYGGNDVYDSYFTDICETPITYESFINSLAQPSESKVSTESTSIEEIRMNLWKDIVVNASMSKIFNTSFLIITHADEMLKEFDERFNK